MDPLITSLFLVCRDRKSTAGRDYHLVSDLQRPLVSDFAGSQHYTAPRAILQNAHHDHTVSTTAMSSLQRSLRNHSPAMLRAIAEANGVEPGQQPGRPDGRATGRDPERCRPPARQRSCLHAGGPGCPGGAAAGGRSQPSSGLRAESTAASARPALASWSGSVRTWPRPTPPRNCGTAACSTRPWSRRPTGWSSSCTCRGNWPSCCRRRRRPLRPFHRQPWPPSPPRQPAADLLLHDACSLLCLVQAGLASLRDPADLHVMAIHTAIRVQPDFVAASR